MSRNLPLLLAVVTQILWSEPGLAQAPFASFDRASEPVLNDPHDLAIGPDGRLYVADKFAGRIAVLDADTLEILESFGEGTMPGVHDISFGLDGKAYIAATGASAVVVYRFDEAGPILESAMTSFANTEGALAHSNGRIYVMASGSGQLVSMAQDGPVAGVNGLFGAHDVAEALDGSIWVADNRRARLVHLTEDLELIKILDDPKYGFIGPRYLDIDDFGRLVVADQDAHRVLLIDPLTGDLEGVIGDGFPGLGANKFDDPEGVAVHGNTYYFSDSDNNRIVKYVVVTN